MYGRSTVCHSHFLLAALASHPIPHFAMLKPVNLGSIKQQSERTEIQLYMLYYNFVSSTMQTSSYRIPGWLENIACSVNEFGIDSNSECFIVTRKKNKNKKKKIGKNYYKMISCQVVYVYNRTKTYSLFSFFSFFPTSFFVG